MGVTFRNVPHKDTGTGHVHRRTRTMDRNLPDRTANPLDVTKPDPRRNIHAVCHHVHTLYAHRVETGARNNRKITRRDREALEQIN